MPSSPVSNFLQSLRQLVAARCECEAPDGHLLEQFTEHRDEAAFEALLDRHGRMVLAVCRRLLADRHDAEDAFQSTFLVLARSARSIRKRPSVGSWLYGVACRVS